MNEGAWRGARVLVTGHTGFKGAWLALWKYKADIMKVIGVCAALGLLLSFLK